MSSERETKTSDTLHRVRRINNPSWINLDDLRELVAASEGLRGELTVCVSNLTALGEDGHSIRDLKRYSAKSIWVEQITNMNKAAADA